MSRTWIPLKQWRYEQAAREGLTDTRIAQKISDGRYPKLQIKRINSRVIFVRVI